MLGSQALKNLFRIKWLLSHACWCSSDRLVAAPSGEGLPSAVTVCDDLGGWDSLQIPPDPQGSLPVRGDELRELADEAFSENYTRAEQRPRDTD